jgi:hypothetical protein
VNGVRFLRRNCDTGKVRELFDHRVALRYLQS